MRLTNRMLLSVISVVLTVAVLGGVVAMAAGGVLAELLSNDTVTYAHGTTVDKNGNFVFT